MQLIVNPSLAASYTSLASAKREALLVASGASGAGAVSHLILLVGGTKRDGEGAQKATPAVRVFLQDHEFLFQSQRGIHGPNCVGESTAWML